MHVSPINNTQAKPKFKARFSKSQIDSILCDPQFKKEAAKRAQLYTILKYVDSLDGKVAMISKNGIYDKILIDNKCASNTLRRISNFDTLYMAFILDEKAGYTPNQYTVRMPLSLFEREWFKNRNVTEQDIKNLCLEI